jgi:hypothetical protein
MSLYELVQKEDKLKKAEAKYALETLTKDPRFQQDFCHSLLSYMKTNRNKSHPGQFSMSTKNFNEISSSLILIDEELTQIDQINYFKKNIPCLRDTSQAIIKRLILYPMSKKIEIRFDDSLLNFNN